MDPCPMISNLRWDCKIKMEITVHRVKAKTTTTKTKPGTLKGNIKLY